MFVDEQHAEHGNAIPPKPKPKYSRRIKNSGGINSEGTGMMLFQNNLEAEAQLAGYGFFPPLVLHAAVKYSLTLGLPKPSIIASLTVLPILETPRFLMAVDRDNFADADTVVIVYYTCTSFYRGWSMKTSTSSS